MTLDPVNGGYKLLYQIFTFPQHSVSDFLSQKSRNLQKFACPSFLHSPKFEQPCLLYQKLRSFQSSPVRSFPCLPKFAHLSKFQGSGHRGCVLQWPQQDVEQRRQRQRRRPARCALLARWREQQPFLFVKNLLCGSSRRGRRCWRERWPWCAGENGG